MVRVTYFTEIFSSWCWYTEPAWADLQQRFAGRVAFTWAIARMNPADFPASRAECDWYYRRSGTITRQPRMLHSGWCTPGVGDWNHPNLVAEAARFLGATDDRVRLALSRAALVDGRELTRLDEAVAVGANAGGLDPAALRAAALSPAVHEAVETSTRRFHALQITQRPAFLLESPIGDRATVSGLWRLEPLVALLETMESDSAAYTSWSSHVGSRP